MLKRRLPLYILFVLLTLILMTYQSIKGPIKPLFYIRYPVHYINEYVMSIVNSVEKPFVVLFSLGQENKFLRDEIARLRLQEQQCKEALHENTRLRELLSIKPYITDYITTSKVIAKGYEKWSHVLTLDKGRADGIKKDMSVRTVNGLLGKIVSSDNHHSRVLLITDADSSVAVRAQDSRLHGILSGTGSAYCTLKYIQTNQDVIVGDTLITSGLDELYPAGIPVGRIISVVKPEVGSFQIIKVEPFSNQLKVEEVIVVEGEQNYK